MRNLVAENNTMSYYANNAVQLLWLSALLCSQ